MRHERDGHARERVILVLETELLDSLVNARIAVELLCIPRSEQELLDAAQVQYPDTGR